VQSLLRTHRSTLQQALLDLDEPCADGDGNPADVINACNALKNACQERRSEAQAAAAKAQRALATAQAARSNAVAALEKVWSSVVRTFAFVPLHVAMIYIIVGSAGVQFLGM
jgi:hypothetical protein